LEVLAIVSTVLSSSLNKLIPCRECARGAFAFQNIIVFLSQNGIQATWTIRFAVVYLAVRLKETSKERLCPRLVKEGRKRQVPS